MKTVSVIIPCYQDATTLERAIQSVLAQSYTAIEIVVVNDCSPQTLEIEQITQRYPQITYLRNETNLGLAGARNAGIAAARGDYIALLDADDEYHLDKIASQVAATKPGLVLTCGVRHIYQNGQEADSKYVRAGSRVFTKPDQLISRNTLNGAGIFIERALLLAHGGYDASLRSCEDFDLWLRLLTQGVQIKDIGQALYLYYENPAGLSKNYLNISKWETEAVLRHAKRIGEAWLASAQGTLVSITWILRQMMRCELQPSQALRSAVLINIDRLICFSWLKVFLKLLHQSHFLFVPVRAMQIFSRYVRT